MRLALLLLALSVAPILAPPAPPLRSPEERRQDTLRALAPVFEATALYHPRKYSENDVAGFISRAGERLEYTTSEGAQVAWLVKPRAGGEPKCVWGVCGGNASLALQWEHFVRSTPFENDAFILIDYPSYGECQGKPSPRSINEGVLAALEAGAKALSIDRAALQSKVCMIGHSLGTAAALMGVEATGGRGAVLLAPFTSTVDFATQKLGIPADAPFKHVFDNRVTLRALASRGGHAWILHGDRDQITPQKMSSTLKDEFADAVTLTLVKGADHNALLSKARADVLNAMTALRDFEPKPPAPSAPAPK